MEHAVAGNQSIVLVTPDPFDAIAALTPAAVHVWRMTVRRQELGGGAPHTDYKIAVISQRYRLRTIYRRLGVETASLFDAAPSATRSPTGAISVLGRNHADWATIFVSRPSELRGLRGLKLVVVELPLNDAADLDAIPLPKIYVAHNTADPYLLRLARSVPTFAWGRADLAADDLRVSDGTALVRVRERLERVAGGVEVETVAVPAQNVSENAAQFWNDIGALLRAGRNSLFARALADAACELFYDLLHLALPLVAYEQLTAPLRPRISWLGHEEYRTRGELTGFYLPMVTLELRDLHKSLGTEPPKADALSRVLLEHLGRHRDVMLVARTAGLARVYESHFRSKREFRALRITSLPAVSEEAPADVAVLTGIAPSWARPIYASGIASEILIVAYDAPEPLQAVRDGFTEASYVRRTVAYQGQYTEWLARPALKARCWRSLSGEDLRIVDDRPDPPAAKINGTQTISLADAPDVPPGLWDVPLPSLVTPNADAYMAAPVARDGDRPTTVHALRIEFEEGRWAVLDADSTVTRFSYGAASAGHPVSRLAVGDEIVFLDGDARKDVLAKVLEVGRDIPELAVRATWVDYWRQALHRGYAQFGTYQAFADALETRGCRREAQSVRLWVVGDVIGPLGADCVKAVGEAIGDAPLRNHPDTVYAGIQAFRETHRQLLQRVGQLARHVGAAAAAGRIEADEIIDARSGLTAADFRGCVDLVRVRRISDAGVVPFIVTGRLHEARDREEHT